VAAAAAPLAAGAVADPAPPAPATGARPARRRAGRISAVVPGAASSCGCWAIAVGSLGRSAAAPPPAGRVGGPCERTAGAPPDDDPAGGAALWAGVAWGGTFWGARDWVGTLGWPRFGSPPPSTISLSGGGSDSLTPLSLSSISFWSPGGCPPGGAATAGSGPGAASASCAAIAAAQAATLPTRTPRRPAGERRGDPIRGIGDAVGSRAGACERSRAHFEHPSMGWGGGGPYSQKPTKGTPISVILSVRTLTAKWILPPPRLGIRTSVMPNVSSVERLTFALG